MESSSPNRTEYILSSIMCVISALLSSDLFLLSVIARSEKNAVRGWQAWFRDRPCLWAKSTPSKRVKTIFVFNFCARMLDQHTGCVSSPWL